MSSLKERFENYSKQPDDKVWQSINQSLNRRVVRRRAVTAASVSAVAASIALALLLNRNHDNNIIVPGQQMASHQPQQVVLNPSSDVMAVEPVSDDRATAVSESKSNIIPMLDPDDEMVIPSPSNPGIDNDVNNGEQTAVINGKSDVTIQTPSGSVSDATNASVVASVTAVSESPATTLSEVQSPSAEQPTASQVKTPRVKAASDSLVVYVPNAFSPNDYNASNPDVRVFKVYPSTSASILSYKIYIYNRSGALVYHSTDIDGAWDGRSRGVDQPMGVYTYILEVTDAVKGIQHKKGTITLIR